MILRYRMGAVLLLKTIDTRIHLAKSGCRMSERKAPQFGLAEPGEDVA